MNYIGSNNNNVQFTLGRFTLLSRNENTGSTLCFLTYPKGKPGIQLNSDQLIN